MKPWGLGAGEYLELARAAADAAGVYAALEQRFPKAARSAAKAQPLKDLYFTAVPARVWKARRSPLRERICMMLARRAAGGWTLCWTCSAWHSQSLDAPRLLHRSQNFQRPG